MTLKLKISIFITFVFLAGFLVSDSASAQVRVENFNVIQKNIPATASKVDFRLTISQQDLNFTCPQGDLDWTVFYTVAQSGGLPFVVRGLSTDSRNTNLPLSSNPLNLDFSLSNFTPNKLVADQGKAFFRAALGCNLGTGNAILNNQIAMSSTVPVTVGTGGGVGGPGGGGGGKPGDSFDFKIENPISAGSFIDLVKAIAKFLLQIAIPIAVIIIIYAGLLFLTSGGKPEKITKARQALLYAVVGLAIILIGQGFVFLIQSILNLGG